MHAWERWLSDSVEHTGQQYREYLAARKAGAARRYLKSKAHAMYFLRGVAPTKLVDGAWLYGLVQQWADPRFAHLIPIYLEELGSGLPSKNHVVLYEKLLASTGCEQWHEQPDDRYTQGAIQLALAYNPTEFLPEIIGFNLGYEQLPLHLPIVAYELNELGIDPYYFTLHITIDNADTGHARRALQGALALAPRLGGEQAFMERVRRGYQLNALGACTESVIRDFDLDREVLDIFARKSVVGKHMHSDYCRIGSKTVTQWLSDPAQMSGFLLAMQDAGWIKRNRDPQESRFWGLLQGDRAEMFGVFSAYEEQMIYDWIAGDAKVGERAPAVEAGGVTFSQRPLTFRARQRLMQTRSQAPANDSELDGLPQLRNTDHDPEMQGFKQRLDAAGSYEQLMGVLCQWMSPALHPTSAGLMATRLFSSRYLVRPV